MSTLFRPCAVIVSMVLLTSAALAAPPRNYTCTNIMGGNAFRLTIRDDLVYTAAAYPESLQKIGGQGRLELAEIGSYYTVLSGPLLDGLQINTIHIMSSGLTPSGASGLFRCNKAK